MKLLLILASFFLMISVSVTAQIIETKLPDGKVVLLKPDGTWTYLNPSDNPIGNCQEYVETKETFNGFSKSTKSFITASSHGGASEIQTHIYRNQDGASMIFYVKGASGCISKGNEIVITFSDGSQYVAVSDSDSNCEGKSSFVFLNDTEIFRLLQRKDISKLRVYTLNGYVEETLNQEIADQMNKSLRCIFPTPFIND